MEKFKIGDLVLVTMEDSGEIESLKATGTVLGFSEDILKVKVKNAFLHVNSLNCKKITPLDYGKAMGMSLKVKELSSQISSLAYSLEKNILCNSCPLPYVYKVNFIDFTSKVSDAAVSIEAEILRFINDL